MKMTITEPNAGRTPNESSFGTSLRFELADDEGRALLGSYAISAAIGIAFLLLLHFGPRVQPVPVVPAANPIAISVGNLQPMDRPIIPDVAESRASAARGRAAGGAATSAAAVIGRALGATSGGLAGMVEDAQGILSRVAVSAGVGGTALGGKVVLAPGGGGSGSAAPGRGGIAGGAGSSADIGGVGGAPGLARAAVSVGAPATIPVAGLPELGRESGEVGTFVRERSAQLRYCYQGGLARDAGLAGSMTLVLTIGTDGAVSAAEIVRPTWSGPAAADTEQCIVRRARAWHLSGARGTYSLPLSFTR